MMACFALFLNYFQRVCHDYFNLRIIFVYLMEIDKTKWYFPWNSEQNCTQNFVVGGGGGAVV